MFGSPFFYILIHKWLSINTIKLLTENGSMIEALMDFELNLKYKNVDFFLLTEKKCYNHNFTYFAHLIVWCQYKGPGNEITNL